MITLLEEIIVTYTKTTYKGTIYKYFILALQVKNKSDFVILPIQKVSRRHHLTTCSFPSSLATKQARTQSV